MVWGCSGDVLVVFWECSGDVLGVFQGGSVGVLGVYNQQPANKRPTNDQQTIPTHPAPAAGVPSRVWGLFGGRLWSFVGRLLVVCWLNTPRTPTEPHWNTPNNPKQTPTNPQQIQNNHQTTTKPLPGAGKCPGQSLAPGALSAGGGGARGGTRGGVGPPIDPFPPPKNWQLITDL